MKNRKFERINPGDFSPEELLQQMKSGLVLLCMNIDTVDFVCRVESLTYYERAGLCDYYPSHLLAEMGVLGETKVDAQTPQEWEARFADEDTWISIRDEEFIYLAEEEYIGAIRAALRPRNGKRHRIETYLSDDNENFYGPLECDFMEWWLRSHPGYHLYTFSEKRGAFEITVYDTLEKYTGKNEETVVLPDGIKRIGASAFWDCDDIKHVIVPEGVEAIEPGAFLHCRSLEDVRLPESLKYIEDHAFNDCESLKEVRMDASTVMEGRIYEDCNPDVKTVISHFFSFPPDSR